MTEAVLDLLAALDDDTRRLAQLCSLAVRVQPALLRAIRLAAAPALPAAAESDLWWSPITVSRSPLAMGLSAAALRRLRVELAQRSRDEPEALRAARDAVVAWHRTEPPVLRLEEEIAWLAVSDGEGARDRIERLLQRALVALARDRQTGIAGWWPGAWARLPDLGRSTPTAAQLCLVTSPLLEGDAVPLPSDAPVELDARLDAALREVPDVAVGVLRTGRVLALGDVSRQLGAAVLAPDTDPRVFQVEWRPEEKPPSTGASGESGWARDVVLLRPGETVQRTVGRGEVRVRNARGSVYDIPRDVTSAAPLRTPGLAPLGATYDGGGTHFALFSGVADRVELSLVDDRGRERRVDLERTRNAVWRAYLPEIRPGQRYGYRVHGPYAPFQGRRCNPSKLLLDPYAKAVEGQVDWGQTVYSYPLDDPNGIDRTDSLGHTMLSVVVDPSFDWGDDRPPRRDYADSVLYEAHVKGLTRLHPGVPEELRGTYAGLASPAILEHLTRLGITAVELQPVHQFIHDPTLLARGLSEYWGYNTIAFFAPHNAYSAGGQRGEQVSEFKTMVRALHQVGIEVILDVVYNHTAEGNHLGPTLSFRGIDNAAYYRLVDSDPTYYYDTTGTGNSPLMRSLPVLRLIMDSLRYWVTEMHVDGFRFDLASTLAREFAEVDRLSTFFDLVQQDPVISEVKLIAEPWDVGAGGYQVGNFPALWSEWNNRYRDTVRDYWRGEPATLGEFALRVTGSQDLYHNDGRRPVASVNYVTSHDGFTLRDLVSYNDKHNEANGEHNRDGESLTRSWNCGVEGETDDEGILELRARQQRNFLTTLLVSQGVPMILHGDEAGRTQRGNNNAYCQDNELSWVEWSWLDSGDSDPRREILEFTGRVLALRRDHPVFRRRRFLGADAVQEGGDIAWFGVRGQAMTDADWAAGEARALAVFLDGERIAEPDERGRRIVDDSFLLFFNAQWEDVAFTVPSTPYPYAWLPELDTAQSSGPRLDGVPGRGIAAGSELVVAARSILVLRRPADGRTAELGRRRAEVPR